MLYLYIARDAQLHYLTIKIVQVLERKKGKWQSRPCVIPGSTLTWHLVNTSSYTVLHPLAAKAIWRKMASQRKFMQVYVLPGKSSNFKGAEETSTYYPRSKLKKIWSSKHKIVKKQNVSNSHQDKSISRVYIWHTPVKNIWIL